MSTAQIKKPFATSAGTTQEEPAKSAAEVFMQGATEVQPPVQKVKIELGMTSTKPRWEDAFKACTFYINRELLELYNKKVKRMPKGGKTLVINEALNYYLIEKPQQDRRIAELEAQIAALQAEQDQG